MKQFSNNPPLLDPIENMNIQEEHLDQVRTGCSTSILSVYNQVVRRIAKLEGKLLKNKLHGKPELEDRYRSYNKKCKLQQEQQEIERKIKSCRTMIMKDELKGMRRVLRRLGHTDDEDVIQTKGRVACELNACKCSIITESITACGK